MDAYAGPYVRRRETSLPSLRGHLGLTTLCARNACSIGLRGLSGCNEGGGTPSVFVG